MRSGGASSPLGHGRNLARFRRELDASGLGSGMTGGQELEALPHADRSVRCPNFIMPVTLVWEHWRSKLQHEVWQLGESSEWDGGMVSKWSEGEVSTPADASCTTAPVSPWNIQRQPPSQTREITEYRGLSLMVSSVDAVISADWLLHRGGREMR